MGVWAHGEAGCEVPDALDKFADVVVGWIGNRIVDAINGEVSTIGKIQMEQNAHRAISIALAVGKEALLRLFSYVVARDYGFAPNPFYGEQLAKL